MSEPHAKIDLFAYLAANAPPIPEFFEPPNVPENDYQDEQRFFRWRIYYALLMEDAIKNKHKAVAEFQSILDEGGAIDWEWHTREEV